MRKALNVACGVVMTTLFVLMFWSQLDLIVATGIAGVHTEASAMLPQLPNLLH
jgi:hypothetical protein